MRKEDRDREREKEAIKQPRSRPFAAPYIAIKCFRRRYEEREKQVIFTMRIFINRNKNGYFLLNDTTIHLDLILIRPKFDERIDNRRKKRLHASNFSRFVCNNILQSKFNITGFFLSSRFSRLPRKIKSARRLISIHEITKCYSSTCPRKRFDI